MIARTATKIAGAAGSCPLLCRLLDRTPSERSEASWSFYSMSERSNRSLNARSLPLPSGMGIDDESDQVT